MSTKKNSEQLQIRIDAATKKEAKKILDSLGMDMSSAVKIFLRQVINTGNFPCELRDVNGFTLQSAQVLRESILDAEKSPNVFSSASDLLKDALSD